MSLALQSQPKEAQLTRDPAQEPHPIGETGEGRDLSGVEHIPPDQAQYIPPGQAQMDRKTRAGKPGGEKMLYQQCSELLEAACTWAGYLTSSSRFLHLQNVCLGCHSRISQTDWLKQQKFIFS